MVDFIDKLKEKIDKRIPVDVKASRFLKKREKERTKQERETKRRKLEELLQAEELGTEEERKIRRLTGEFEKERTVKRLKRKKKIKAVSKEFEGALKGVTQAVKKGTRAYKKSTKWYKTRYKGGGQYRSPQQFEKRGTTGKFTIGGIGTRGESIANLGVGRPWDTKFSQPLEDKERGGIGLGGKPGLLDIRQGGARKD